MVDTGPHCNLGDNMRRKFLWGLCAAAFGLVAGLAGCDNGSGGKTSTVGCVVLVSVDTLRADHLTLYGPSPVSTPNMDRIGQEGATARTAWAPFGRTTQSVGSFLTGLHPLRHGADGLGMPLPDRVVTLAERFKAAGYRTAAFVSNMHLQKGAGFEQGFDVYSNPPSRWATDSAGPLTEEALAWLGDQVARAEGAPLFLWIHYLDPHWPYQPGPELVEQFDPEWDGSYDLFERVSSGDITKGDVIFHAAERLTGREIENTRLRYAAEVHANDVAVGRLLSGMEELGLADAPLLFTADHGESLGEHRYWFAHGEYVYDDTLHVPFLVRAPGRIPPGTVLGGPVLLEDVMPTLLDLAGLDVPDDLDGRSLAPELTAGGDVTLPVREVIHLADHNLVREENPRRPVAGREGRWWAIRQGGWKLIQIPQPDGSMEEELYHVDADPGETRNLVHEATEQLDRLRDLLEARREGLLAVAPKGDSRVHQEDIPADQLERLRELGYVN